MPELPYVLPPHGGQMRALCEQYSLVPERLTDFSASIYPFGPPQGVLDALIYAAHHPESLRIYPDLEEKELRSALGVYVSISAKNIATGNGMAVLLAASLRALNVQRCLILTPAFGEYRKILERESVEVHTFPLSEGNVFLPDLASVLTQSVAKRCDTVILNSPHNPTGIALSRNELEQFVLCAGHNNIRVLLDEAFVDFLPDESLATLARQSDNLIVLRSLTKFFSMPALRVAYLVATEDRIRSIEQFLDPWMISTTASRAAIAAVHSRGYIEETIRINRNERQWLTNELLEAGLQVLPGSANFLLFRLPVSFQKMNIWERLIVEHGIVVRNCATFEDLGRGFMRIAVKDRTSHERLLEALRSVLHRTPSPAI